MNTAILRSRILDLAIHGQLVPQDSSEGTAAELLQDISKHRGKAIIPITTDVPFDIPDSWKWVKLGDICSKLSTGPFGTMIHKRDYVIENGVPLVNPTNIKNGAIEQIGIKKIGIDKYQELQAYVLKVGDIIVARRGDLRKCAIISQKENGWLAGTGAFFIRTNSVDLSFICLLYTSNYVQESLTDDSIGSTMDNLNQSLLKNLPFPLPPLSEQQRIVSRVEELLKQVDIIEQAQLDIRQTATILRSKILDKALSGELTNSETSKWDKTTIGNVADIINGFAFKSSNYTPTGIRVIRIANVQDGYIKDDSPAFYPLEEEKNLIGYMLKGGDLLMSLTGNVGRVGILQKEMLPAALNQRVACLRCHSEKIDILYLFTICRSHKFVTDCIESSTGVAQKNMSTEWLKRYPIPLPPLSEQQRIVAKIEELFKQIDLLMQ